MEREIQCPVCRNSVTADAQAFASADDEARAVRETLFYYDDADGPFSKKNLDLRRAKPFECGVCGSTLGLDCIIKVNISDRDVDLIQEGDEDYQEDVLHRWLEDDEESIQVEARCPYCGHGAGVNVNTESITERSRSFRRTQKVECRNCGSKLEVPYSVTIRNQVTVMEKGEDWE